jgi:preprotein translocase subunit SecY
MAKQPGLDFQSAKGGLGELKRRLLFVIGALIVFRIGSFIPIPGIDAAVLAKLLEQQRGTIIEMFNMFSGGALSRASIFAGYHAVYFGIDYCPLLTVVYQPLAEMKKEGSLVVVRSASTPATVLWCWRYSSRSVLLPVCRICLVCRAW